MLDSRKVLDLGEKFGVGKYSKYFPVIFTGRTIERLVLSPSIYLLILTKR